MNALLSPEAIDVLDNERAFLGALKSLMKRLEVDDETIEQLGDVIDGLRQLFLVVVVGEFNAGKSSFLNALFGEKLLEEGPIPTTAKITVLRYGAEPLERQLSEFVVERRLPADLLRHINLVDTPGTNSVVKQHQAITEDFIPRSDLVLFVTSFDRPLSESERQFLNFIREAWGKRLVFVLNKSDLAKGDSAILNQVLQHIRSTSQELLNFEPRIFPVSSEKAYAAKNAESEEIRAQLWDESRFGPVEEFINKTLTGPERLALKFTAPLDSAAQLMKSLDRSLDERKAALESDELTLAGFEEKVAEESREMHEGYQRYLTEVDNLLLEMEKRGVQFLEDNIRMGKLGLIRDKDRFKEEFARQVVRDHERQIEDRMTEAVDWLLRQLLQLWNWTLNHFTEKTRAISDAGTRHSFDYNRVEVMEGIMRQARRRIESYDLYEEGRRILENAQNAAALFLGAEAVAAGIGVIATVLIVAAGVDVTGGLVASGAVALLGLFFLPRQRRKAVSEFRERVQQLRDEMKSTLATQFDEEIDEGIDRLRQTVAPYVDLVKEERQILQETTWARSDLADQMEKLRTQVNTTFGPVHDTAFVDQPS